MTTSEYLIANSLVGIEYRLFSGPGQYYDPSFIALDFAARGTITIGEAITVDLGISVTEEYTDAALVLTGNQNVAFCGTLDLAIDGSGNCNGSGTLEETQTLYPRARPYSWFSLTIQVIAGNIITQPKPASNMRMTGWHSKDFERKEANRPLHFGGNSTAVKGYLL
jgi:hypothetical protein